MPAGERCCARFPVSATPIQVLPERVECERSPMSGGFRNGRSRNYRELEQCVKNVLIRRNYRPSGAGPANPMEEFAADAAAGRLTAAELLGRYVTIVFSRAGSYEETARRLGLDRRTIKSNVDPHPLGRLRRN